MKYSSLFESEQLPYIVKTYPTSLGESIVWTRRGHDLTGAPQKITNSFVCGEMNLTSLKGCPQQIPGSFSCIVNELNDLEFAPKYVGANYYCHGNKIETLGNYIQERINGDFHCYNNKLTSLEGSPKYVGGSFYAGANEIDSFKGSPEHIGYNYSLAFTHIKSPVGIDDHIKYIGGELILSKCQIIEGGLGLLMIEGLMNVKTYNCPGEFVEAMKIIRKYLWAQNPADYIYECQKVLIDAGLERFAQL